MRPLALTHIVLAAALATAPLLHAQDSTHKGKALRKANKKAELNIDLKPAKVSQFWLSQTPFEMTLTINLKKIRNDKVNGPWEPATVTYVDSGTTITLPVRVRARGHSRLKICTSFPPVWINFDKADTKKQIFDHLNKFKLVSPCKPQSAYENYVVEEFNLYRLHALMTPVSHLARLIKMTVVDSASKNVEFTRYSFAVEDADELAARLAGKKFPVEGATAADLDVRQTAVIGILQYMIGNTDFSIYALHNAELVQLKQGVFPVAYDFDQSGIINTPYAIPDPKVGIRSVTERIYRGLCVSPDTINKVLADLREKRPAINALYADSLGMLISDRGRKDSIKWFDDFYSDVSNPKTVKNEIIDRCRDVR